MVKSQVFDPALIRKFRDQFNDGDFGYLRYRNRNGKDDFSAICSAMDWIEVAIDYINNFTLSNSRDNIISMEIFSFIMAVDIIYSCINTMHGIILNTSKANPFSDSHEIFKLEINDNKHFKKIRAAFGAHPTDLRNKPNMEIKYASWSVPNSFGYDFSVFLYSSIPGKKSDIYGFHIDDLIDFVKIRYEYLEVLINEIQKQDATIQEELKSKLISKSGNLATRISILKGTAEERFGRSHYYYALIDIETMLNAPCTFTENEDSVEKYKQQLYEAIDNIENNLQQMKFEQMPSLNIVEPDYWPSEISYDLEKVYEAISNDGWYRAMLPYHLERVAPHLKGIERINPELNSDELLLLLNAGRYFAGEKKS